MSTHDVRGADEMSDATADERAILLELGHGAESADLMSMHHGVLEALRKGYELGASDALDGVPWWGSWWESW